jgi:hypothetical protein
VLFHEDRMELRILCTYAGPGMQWVANADVDRSQLGSRGRQPKEANAPNVRDSRCIRSMLTGHVAAFKGALCPQNNAGSLIHRSAPVSGPNEYRIRLTIDDTSDCGCSL